MKNLKIKFGFFSLLAILAVSVFLTSCEQEAIETISSDVLLESSGESTSTSITEIDGFQDMLFSQTKVSVFADDGSNMLIELNGELLVDSGGDVSGSVTAVSDDGAVNGTVAFRNGIIIYETENGSVEFDLLSDVENLTVVESGATKKSTLSNSIDELIENRYNRSTELSLELQAAKAYLAIFNSEAFMANARYAQSSNDVHLRGCSWWQYGIVYTAAAAATTALALGCGSIVAGCVPATGVTFGGLALPCAAVAALCVGGTGATFAITYDVVKNWVCDGELPPAQEPCNPPSNVNANVIGAHTFQLSWSTTNSADYHWLYYWSGSSWVYFHTVTSSPATLTTYGYACVAVEAVCDGMGSGIGGNACVNLPLVVGEDTDGKVQAVQQTEVK